MNYPSLLDSFEHQMDYPASSRHLGLWLDVQHTLSIDWLRGCPYPGPGSRKLKANEARAHLS